MQIRLVLAAPVSEKPQDEERMHVGVEENTVEHVGNGLEAGCVGGG